MFLLDQQYILLTRMYVFILFNSHFRRCFSVRRWEWQWRLVQCEIRSTLVACDFCWGRGVRYQLQKNCHIFSCISWFVYKLTPVFQAKNNNIFESSCISQPPWLIIKNRMNQGHETIIRRSDWYFLFQCLVAPKGAISLVVLKNQCGPSRHLPGFSTISWGGPSCTSLLSCCGPSRHFPGFSTVSWGEDLVQALWFCWSVFFAHVLVEVQFLGYKFCLKGSTYTRENTVVLLGTNPVDLKE